MALRQIRMIGDEMLSKKCREVKTMTPRIRQLIEDMFETMYDANGVGLAAPQVGVLRRIIVIDLGEEAEEEEGEKIGPLVLINPEILETEGEQTGQEGCLSLPGQAGMVTRPNYVKVKALNEDMEEITVEGTALLARAICHECDHLEGITFVEKVEGELFEVTSGQDGDEEEEEEEEEQTEGERHD